MIKGCCLRAARSRSRGPQGRCRRSTWCCSGRRMVIIATNMNFRGLRQHMRPRACPITGRVESFIDAYKPRWIITDRTVSIKDSTASYRWLHPATALRAVEH